MRTKGLRNRIVAGLMALVMIITTWIPTEQVKADDSNLPAATNTTFATARELQFNTSIAEELSSSDNVRYYKFSVSEASELILRGEKASDNWRDWIYIYDASKTSIYEFSFYGTFSQSIYLTGGEYYLKIDSEDSLSFIASVNSLSESFTETQDVNNDVIDNASSIALKTKYKGALTQNDEVDYYKFTVPAAGRINFNMTNATNGTLKYAIYDSSVNATYIKTVAENGKVSEYITLAKGTYYLAITKNDSNRGVGSYNFNIDYVANVPTAPKIKSVKNTSKKKMTVKWSKVTGADGYELQYSIKSNFKSKVVKKTISASKTSAAYSKLTKGKTYYVRMRSYVNVDGVKKYSSWSSKKSVKIKK